MSNRFSELKNLSAEQLLARAGAVLPPWVSLLLVLAIAWQLTRVTWLLLPQGEALTRLPEPATPAAQAQRAAPTGVNVERIAATAIFGKAPDEAEIDPGPILEDVPDSGANLTLHGTIAAADDQLALAIIADDRGEENVYAVGDAIGNGRKLHAVFPDRVILNNNGELEALRMPREFATAASPPTRRTSRFTSRTQARVARELQASITANPAKLTDLIRPQPVFSNGKQLGYRVYPGRRRQQFVSLGLKPGDLVTEINGTPLDDPTKGADIFRSLADSSQVTVTVQRNGSPEILVLDTEQLNLQDGQRR